MALGRRSYFRVHSFLFSDLFGRTNVYFAVILRVVSAEFEWVDPFRPLSNPLRVCSKNSRFAFCVHEASIDLTSRTHMNFRLPRRDIKHTASGCMDQSCPFAELHRTWTLPCHGAGSRADTQMLWLVRVSACSFAATTTWLTCTPRVHLVWQQATYNTSSLRRVVRQRHPVVTMPNMLYCCCAMRHPVVTVPRLHAPRYGCERGGQAGSPRRRDSAVGGPEPQQATVVRRDPTTPPGVCAQPDVHVPTRDRDLRAQRRRQRGWRAGVRAHGRRRPRVHTQPGGLAPATRDPYCPC